MADGSEATGTRERILKAGRDIFAKHGARASMSQIAVAAGVSRQTLYLHFGDRTGLLRALMSSWVQEDPGMRVRQAASRLPPLAAFETNFRNWISAAIRIEAVLRPYWREAEDDAELMAAVRGSDLTMYEGYKALFARLHAEGVLRPIWTAREAADAAYQTTMYGVFVGHLRNMRGWPPEEIEARGMKVLRATFLTDAAARKAATIKVPTAQ